MEKDRMIEEPETPFQNGKRNCSAGYCANEKPNAVVHILVGWERHLSDIFPTLMD
jgi:hypothetical protein